MGLRILLLLLLPLPTWAGGSAFRDGNELARAGDYPKAIAAYRGLAAQGHESASLYWNWAQVAEARGETGEALWALLRGREVEPGDAKTGREIERLREAASLDPSEIAPVPLSVAERTSRRLHLSELALLFLATSIVLHVLARRADQPRRLGVAAGIVLGLGLLAAAVPVAGSLASPTAVVVRRSAPLLDAASPNAGTLGTLRQGEVVVVLAESGGYLRVEDSSGARGWASDAEVWRLDETPESQPLQAE